MMEDRSETKRVLKTFSEGRQEIILCYLFGSYLQMTRGFRDIDIPSMPTLVFFLL